MLPPIDISDIAEQLGGLGEDIQQAFEASTDVVEPAPPVLLEGLAQLFETMRSTHWSAPETDVIAERLLEHGLRLLTQLAGVAEQLNLPRHAQDVSQLCLPLACWMLRHGAELRHPEPIVNAAAYLANRLKEPHRLAELFELLSEIMHGIGLERTLDMERDNTEQLWSVLLLNRAIVATRSQQPRLMEDAFQAVAEHLPEAAPDFFREGMGQMASPDYPSHVREVMQRYFDLWCVGQRLH